MLLTWQCIINLANEILEWIAYDHLLMLRCCCTVTSEQQSANAEEQDNDLEKQTKED